MRKAAGILCLLAGLCMVALSAGMLVQNRAEEQSAQTQAETILAHLRQLPVPTLPPQPASPQIAPPSPTPVPEMPTIVVEGEACIGYLELPTLSLNLPVLSPWSYTSLRKAPCHYWGNVYDDTLILLAHNYTRHFGSIHLLEVGDPVQFVDAVGEIFRYTVSGSEILAPGDVERMIHDDADLTLFTCTYGGTNRVTVRLTRVLSF